MCLETVDFEKMFDRYGWDYNDLDIIVKIIQEPTWAYFCARDLIKGRWSEAEPAIMKDADAAYSYAKAEPFIQSCIRCWRNFIQSSIRCWRKYR